MKEQLSIPKGILDGRYMPSWYAEERCIFRDAFFAQDVDWAYCLLAA